MNNQKKTLIIFLFFLSAINFKIFSQDKIFKINGETIETEISTIEIDVVKYKKFDNLNGPVYVIEKNEVEKIIFKNGTTEKITEVKQNKELSLQEVKDFIVKEINEHGYEEDSFKSKYKASFENNYLRLTELKKNSTKETNHTILYDFSNVYKFQRVSRRSDKLAFLNVWVSIMKNEKKKKFDKHKLIMRVDDPVKAEAILEALKQLNKLVLEQGN